MVSYNQNLFFSTLQIYLSKEEKTGAPEGDTYDKVNKQTADKINKQKCKQTADKVNNLLKELQ